MIGLSFKKLACNRRRRPSPGSRAGAGGSRRILVLRPVSAVRHDVQARSPDMPAGRLGRLPGRGGIEFGPEEVRRRGDALEPFGGDVELPPRSGSMMPAIIGCIRSMAGLDQNRSRVSTSSSLTKRPVRGTATPGARGCCRGSAPPMPGWNAAQFRHAGRAQVVEAVHLQAGAHAAGPGQHARARPGSSSTRPRNPATRRRCGRGRCPACPSRPGCGRHSPAACSRRPACPSCHGPACPRR